MIGKALVSVAMGGVAVVLGLGLYTMFKGGAVSATWSNRLMRIRVLAQAIAIVIIIAVAYFSHSH